MTTGTLIIPDKTGDTRIDWDSADPTSVAVAKAAFDKAKESRALAYKATPGGARGEVIREFDPAAEHIILAPQLVGG